MSIKNIITETMSLHVGDPVWSRPDQSTLTKAGVLTCGGISIFGDCSSIGGQASVTIGPADGDSLQKNKELSLYILGKSFQLGDQTQIGDYKLTGDQKIEGNLTITQTMKAGFATWSSSIVATTKLFDIKHPSKENYRLAHASLEGPEIGVYCRGRLTGSNSIDLPSYWKDLVDPESVTVNLTQIRTSQDLIVYDYIFMENKIFVRSGNGPECEIDCYYTVYGERKDVDKLKVEYEGDTIMEQGKPK